jgi:hypothetical protein
VIDDPALRARVERRLGSIPPAAGQTHGIAIHRRRILPRALVFWGDFPKAGDALAREIRAILGSGWEVSQVGPPEGWGKFRTATEENPYCY